MLHQNDTSFATTRDLITAEAPDRPSFLFSRPEVEKAVATFRDGIDGLLTYAIKANPADHLVRALADNGVTTFDVASPNEMAELQRIVPGAAMHYNNPVRSRREITRAWEEFKVRSFSLDHINQLDQITSIVPASKDVEITIRFKAGKTQRAYDFGTKFGALEDNATNLAGEAKARGYSVSLCFHVGSQCEETYAYERHIAAAARIAKQSGIDLGRLNVGGGFPAKYPTSAAPPMKRYFDNIRRALKANFGDSPPRLILEPGRRLAAPSTALLLRVKHRRNDNAVYLNDGVYGSLLEVKFVPFLPPVRVWRDGEVVTGDTIPLTIFGPTCDSYDSLPRPFDLPDTIREDDWIEFGLMGAYAQASTTGFNGFSERNQYFVDEILSAS